MSYFKLTNKKENHNGFQFKTGLNTDILPFNDDPNDSCCKGGLYFSDEKHIYSFLGNHYWIREVTLPENEKVIRDKRDKWRTHQLILSKRKDLSKVATWKWMLKQGIDIQAKDNGAIRWASQNGHLPVVKYLHENGSDITAFNNYAIRWASLNGHLEVVKYLHENGADIQADDNLSIRWASLKGHLEVVKYLHENGADIQANNYAIRWASSNGHLPVVAYLKKHGAKL